MSRFQPILNDDHRQRTSGEQDPAFLPAGRGRRFHCQILLSDSRKKTNDEISLKPDNPIVTYLQKGNDRIDLKQVDNIPQFKGIWQTDKEKIAVEAIQL